MIIEICKRLPNCKHASDCLVHTDSKYIHFSIDGIYLDIPKIGTFFYNYDWFDQITVQDKKYHYFTVLWELDSK